MKFFFRGSLAVSLALALLSCNNPIAQQVKTIQSQAVSPHMSLSRGKTAIAAQTQLDFGEATTNGGSKTISLIVSNSGIRDLAVDCAKIQFLRDDGSPEPGFSASPAALTTIVPNSNAQLSLSFSPLLSGPTSATIVIPTNDVDNSRFSFTVLGTGISVSSAKDITAFSIGATVGAIMDRNIAVTVPYDADITKLVASFASTGLSVSVGLNTQISGQTSNDFTNPVTYTVSAVDGTKRDFTVTVSVAKSSAKAITAFGFAGIPSTASIGASSIAATVPYGTDLTDLAATFTASPHATVWVGSTQQTSGTGSQKDFSHPVSYTVIAEDGSSASYQVTVSTATASDNSITVFTIPGALGPGVIDESSTPATIKIDLPFGTNLSLALTPSFSTSALVYVGAALQTSGISQQIINPTIRYKVAAFNGATKNYDVTVTLKPVVPSLTTGAVGSITLSTASCAGTVASYGGSPITDCGICWNTSGNPTVSDGHKSSGATGDLTGSSLPTCALGPLSSGTLYYARAYATNGVGTGYGPQVLFWTPLDTATAPTAAAVDGPAGSGQLALAWSSLSGATSYYVYCSTVNSYSGLTPISQPSGNSVTLNSLVDFTQYYVWVQGNNPNTPGPMSPVGAGIPGKHVTSLGLDFHAKTIEVGSNATLVATIGPTNATHQTADWSSSNTAVATVSSSGLITAVSTGTATITAAGKSPDGAVTDTCTVTIVVPVNGMGVWDYSNWDQATWQ